MATPNIYKSNDASAPLLTSGQAYTVLKQCLVTGYGSKSGAGWTLAFDDPANKKAVFKNANGDCALRVDGSVATGYCQVSAADDFSDIDTAVGTVWSGSTLFSIPNYTTAGNRPWLCAATDELVIFMSSNANSLTTHAVNNGPFPVLIFGRAFPRGDSVVANVMMGNTGLSSSPAGSTTAAYANIGTVSVVGACSRDWEGGTSHSRMLITYIGMLPRYESAPGTYASASYVGGAGPNYDDQANIQAERLTFFREDGSIVGDVPIVLPYARLDPGIYGGDIDSTVTLGGITHSVFPVYNQNTAASYGRILVPHDGW
jgi:hypothetical protein